MCNVSQFTTVRRGRTAKFFDFPRKKEKKNKTRISFSPKIGLKWKKKTRKEENSLVLLSSAANVCAVPPDGSRRCLLFSVTRLFHARRYRTRKKRKAHNCSFIIAFFSIAAENSHRRRVARAGGECALYLIIHSFTRPRECRSRIQKAKYIRRVNKCLLVQPLPLLFSPILFCLAGVRWMRARMVSRIERVDGEREREPRTWYEF